MLDPLTTRSTPSEAEHASRRCIAARVLAHPDWRRVGEFAPLCDAGAEGTVEINRNSPDFRATDGRSTGPLASSRITRVPLYLEFRADQVIIRHASPAHTVEVNGQPLLGEMALPLAALQTGVVVLFGKYLTLVVRWLELIDFASSAPSMVGDCSAMRMLRQEIQRIAETDVPVLLRGETGVGKELVAAALHAGSTRYAAPYVAVNMASVPPSLAASELFGHRRGAFSGAVKEHKGYFSQAHGGTLFLDEIGDVVTEVQTALLRAVESGVIQPLGGSTVKVDVRLIAATDSNLELAIAKREFREPLLRRFSYEISLPPLRARRDDVGLLFVHFLRQRLAGLHVSGRLMPAESDPEPWIPASFVAALALYDWPGNVRELSNVALRFVLENRDRPVARISAALLGLLRPGAQRSSASSEPTLLTTPALVATEKSVGPPSALSDAQLVSAVRAAQYHRERAAKALGVSKSYLYKRLAQIPEIRSLADIPGAEVQAALDATAGNVCAAAERLQVSDRALKIHLKRTPDSHRP
ncbi:MAG: sigma 54-interacting transcriptional regulator [Pseudomonadota bacterium]